MLRSLRAPVHLALNLEPRDESAGPWATVCLVLAVLAGVVYLADLGDANLLFVGLGLVNASLMNLFKPAAKRVRGSWLVVAFAGAVGGTIAARQHHALVLTTNQLDYLLGGAFLLLITWQILDRFVLKPNAFERRRLESMDSSSEEFPRL